MSAVPMAAKAAPSGTLDRRALLIGAGFAATAAAAYGLMPRRAEDRLARRKLSDVIAPKIGPWQFASTNGVVVAREDEETTGIDGYDQVLTRVYSAAGLPSVMLLIAYGSTQGGSLQLHRPESCYPGQGFRLSGYADVDMVLPGPVEVAMRHFTAQRDDRVERVLYWTRIARDFPRTTAEEYHAILGAVLRGVVPDGVLVRLSTLDSDAANADAALTAFAKALVADGLPSERELLVGR